MLQTSARLLRLLGLFQTRRDWSGPELADRLGVTTRTIRNDVDRLRSLGYPVSATPGVAGGYRLGAGAALPPLLLTDDEAVAMAVGLRTSAATGSVAGIEEASVGALAKLENVLPARLRRRVNALQKYTVPIRTSLNSADPSVLTAVAAACRDHERLRFDYVSHDGSEAVRTVEPHRLAYLRGRWYLVGWDVDRAGWRTFRVDRLSPRTPAGPRFVPRELPAGGIAAFVTEGTGAATWRYRFTVKLHAAAREVAPKLPPPVRVDPVDDKTCIMRAGSDSLDLGAVYIGMLDVDFEVIDPPELADRLRALAARYLRAAGG